MKFWRLYVAGALSIGILSGCGQPKHLFVLLPEEDGSVGRVSVTNPQGGQVLDQAWQMTGMDSAEEAPRTPRITSAEQVEILFGDVLAVQPQRPLHFILYFKEDSSDLTEASRARMPAVIEAIHARQSVDTSVVGHTDTVGPNDYNIRLSQERAEIIARQLVEAGIDATILEISSHGERNLLIATGDEVFEPRNRRVEITVR
ncbi:MAG: hypothetical protein A2X84_09760 [Desulfuromonadaceae bacterium GWC2_58_13]|nr:MAG: hypothetical protein A2X84_09760 [Desulfuromonadaceae bacterium GWC2_58_13]